MGCGKTYWGREMSRKLGMPFFDLDEQVEQQAGKPITKIFAEEGEEYFRMLEKDVLYSITDRNETFVMACGGGTPCFFNSIDYMNRKGTTVWINCSVDCLYKRLLGEKEKRPLIRDLSDDELHQYITKKYFDRKIYYQQAKTILNEHEINLQKLVDLTFHT